MDVALTTPIAEGDPALLRRGNRRDWFPGAWGAKGDILRQAEPPKLVRRTEPDYPEIARQARIEGTVIIEATTDVRGADASIPA